MEPEPEWVFWSRRVFVEPLEGLCDKDSIDELLRDRIALEKARGFLDSIVSVSSVESRGIGRGEDARRLGRVFLLHLSACILKNGLIIDVSDPDPAVVVTMS